MTKILIVEDETIVALDIKSAVKKLGYEVTDTATNFHDAIKSIRDNKPDIVLMDIHLENSKDGIETVREIQKKYYIPVIYLTAFSDDSTISRAVETNPIGYIIKPFKREDLKSTIALGLHKINTTKKATVNEDYINLGSSYFYDLKNENLYYENLPIKLSIKENLLLNALALAKGNLVSFSELENLIWTESVVSESALRTLIYRLRSKLEYKLIETVPSFGCKINL